MANGDGFWYVLKRGDTLSRLAKRFGLKRWDDIYNHEKNEDFRELRPDPNVIYVGDHVWIPGKRANTGKAASGRLAKFFGRTTDVILLSLEFLSDHGLMKENDADWANTGPLIPAPEWRPNRARPVSVDTASTLQLKARVNVRTRSSKQVEGRLIGVGKDAWSSFRGDITLSPGTKEVEVTADGPLPNLMGEVTIPSISWKVAIEGGEYVAGTSGPHVLYTTCAAPIEDGRPEDGVTTRRMTTATRWYCATGDAVEVLDIIEEWFKRFPAYILSFDMLSRKQQKYLDKHKDLKNRMTQAGFSAYMKGAVGGAWPLAEFEKYGGECQAIVRFIRGLKNQIGLPGTAEVKYVNADASDYMTPVIKDRGSRVTGPDKKKNYALVDREVKVGKAYTQAEVGWNNFEAYMKFTYDDGAGSAQVAWFGGGVGKIGQVDANDPDAVAELERTLILVFWGLAEYEFVYAQGGTKKKVTRVWEYPHPVE